jgi:hypothetical protein
MVNSALVPEIYKNESNPEKILESTIIWKNFRQDCKNNNSSFFFLAELTF